MEQGKTEGDGGERPKYAAIFSTDSAARGEEGTGVQDRLEGSREGGEVERAGVVEGWEEG